MGNGSVAGALVLGSNGAIHPGRPNGSTGTFAVGGDATLGGGSFHWELSGSSSDRLEVGGTLDLSGASLYIKPLAGGVTEDVYILARYGSCSGSFARVYDLPQDYIDYAFNDGLSSNHLALVRSSQSAYLTWAGAKGLVIGTNVIHSRTPTTTAAPTSSNLPSTATRCPAPPMARYTSR